MPKIHNGSNLVNYDTRGTGPAAILFNHSGTSNLSWSERFLETMAEAFTIVTPDHRGTGLSSPASSEFSLADLAEDGRAVLQAQGVDQALVIGTSMGGAVAQEFALNFPDQVSALVLLGTFAGTQHRVLPDPDVMTLMERASKVASKVERWRQMLPTIYSPTFLQQYEELALELELKGVRFATEETLKWHGRAVSNFEAYDRLPSLAVPTLVIHGTDDPIIPLENGKILARRISHSEFVPLEGVGHLPAVEQPLDVAARIRNFALVQGWIVA